MRFQFRNVGPDVSTITSVYFDDSSHLFTGIDRINDPSGGEFSRGSSTSLYGASNLTPGFNTNFSASADSGLLANGVNPWERVNVLFDMRSDVSYHGVLNAIESGALRIGINVDGFAASRAGEGFVISPQGAPPLVPEPSGMALAGLGLAGLFWRRRSLSEPAS